MEGRRSIGRQIEREKHEAAKPEGRGCQRQKILWRQCIRAADPSIPGDLKTRKRTETSCQIEIHSFDKNN